MKNVKGIAVVTDGSLKRIAVTFDVVEDNGTISKINQRINRVVTDSAVIDNISALEQYAQTIIDSAK